MDVISLGSVCGVLRLCRAALVEAADDKQLGRTITRYWCVGLLEIDRFSECDHPIA